MTIEPAKIPLRIPTRVCMQGLIIVIRIYGRKEEGS